MLRDSRISYIYIFIPLGFFEFKFKFYEFDRKNLEKFKPFTKKIVQGIKGEINLNKRGTMKAKAKKQALPIVVVKLGDGLDIKDKSIKSKPRIAKQRVGCSLLRGK